MANFDKAYIRTSIYEGGYANVKGKISVGASKV